MRGVYCHPVLSPGSEAALVPGSLPPTAVRRCPVATAYLQASSSGSHLPERPKFFPSKSQTPPRLFFLGSR